MFLSDRAMFISDWALLFTSDYVVQQLGGYILFLSNWVMFSVYVFNDLVMFIDHEEEGFFFSVSVMLFRD